MPLQGANEDAIIAAVLRGRGPVRVEAAARDGAAVYARATIGDRFREQVRRRGDALAMSDGAAEWSYAELDRRSTRVARLVLEGIGTRPTLVALLLDQGAAAIAAILGVIKSGHAFIALDPKHPTAWVCGQLEHLGAALVITAPERLDAVRALAPAGVRVMAVEGGDDGRDEPLEIEIDPDTPACIISTSGSTGEPKGVIKTHAGLLHSAWHYIAAAGATPEDRFALLAPVGFMASIPPMLSAFLSGASLFPFVVGEHGVEALIEWIAARRITVYDSVPTLFRRVARAVTDRGAFASVRLVRLGGETIRPSDVRLVRETVPRPVSLQIFLGSSEASMISQNVIGPDDPVPEGLMPLGRPVEGLEVVLVGEDGREVERGQPGRMLVRGRPVSPGYWRNEAATAAAFRSDPRDPSIRTYQTSDFARWRPDGMLEHLGRTEEFAKVRGTRVSPAVAESVLAELPDVRDAAVIARADQGEERLVAYVVAQTGRRLTEPWLREALRERIPEAMAPGAYVIMRSLPLTPNGKVDRKALPAPVHAARPEWRRPRDAIECAVAATVEELLGVERVGLDDSFRNLGGTSLDAVRLLLRLEQTMARRLPDSIMADHDRVEELAAAVARVDVAPGVVVRHKEPGSKRPFFCVHPVNGMAGFYGPLARAIDPERPFYAIQSSGLSGTWPQSSIGAMAERYIGAIREIQPRGPYLLGGVCTGGLIAWEMAQRLAAAGEPVALVALIETWRRSFGRKDGAAQSIQFAARHAARMARWRLALVLADRRGGGLLPSSWPAWRQFVNYMNAAATRRYRPGPYAGRVAILIADDEPRDGPVDERLAMKDLVTGPVEVASVPGTHANVCDGARVAVLAGTLRRMLDEAERRGMKE